MKYKVVLERPARKFIQKQPPEQQKRILTALSKLPEQGDISRCGAEKTNTVFGSAPIEQSIV